MGTANGRASRVSRALTLLVGLVVAAAILTWGFSRSPRNAFDDAYISYRYADNLRRGLGLVYNPGEWVLGTTAPLYVLLLGALGLIVQDLEALAHWLGVLGWLCAALTSMALLRQARRPWAGCVAALLLAAQPSLSSSLGMETPFLVALMLAAAWAWLGGRRTLAAILAAAMLVTRQDSALWLLLLGLQVWRKKRVLPWREGVAALLLSSPWFVFAWWRYGSILPNSALAKIGQNALMPVGGQAPFWQTLWRTGMAGLPPAVVGIAALGLLLGVWVIVRRERSFWWLGAWTVLYVALYTWMRVVNFPWYFVPPLAGLAIITALGFGHLLGDRETGGTQRREPVQHLLPIRLRYALGASLLLALLMVRGAQMRSASRGRGYRAAYVPTGQWLSQNTPADSSVASIEIGVIGYLSQRPMLDTMGLVSADMTHHQVGWVETLVYALNAHQPEYAVALPNTGWDAIVGKWWFEAQYEAVVQFSEVTIYHLRERPEPLIEMPAYAEYSDGMTLAGLSANRWLLEPEATLDAWLHVEAHSPQPDYLVFSLYLMDVQTYARIALTEAEPFDGLYRSSRWQGGDRLSLPMRLELPRQLDPGAYRLGLAVHDAKTGTHLRLKDLPDVAEPDVHLGWFRVGDPPLPPGESELAQRPVLAQWQAGIELSSVGLPAQPLTPGDVLAVGLVWRCIQPPDRDLTVFVHLTDSDGEIVAQQDRKPLGGRWPTPVWRPGDLLADRYELILPEDLSPGRYGLRIGFYDRSGRLLLADGSADHWLLPDAVEVQDE